MFTRDDWTLFRNLATLGQKAGVPRHRLAALTSKILADAGLDEQVKRAMRYADLPTEDDTEYEVRDCLGLDKTASWEKPLDQLAEKAAREAVA